MGKTITTKKFLGLRNDLPLERFAAGDLSVASNVEIDETGKLSMRAGTTRVRTGVWHSIFSAGDYGYAVVDGVLSYLDGAVAPIPIVAVKGSSVSYALSGPDVYWSDGVTNGILRGGANRSLGIQPPPVISATGSTGRTDARTGTALFTMTYLRGKEESGAPAYGAAVTDGTLQFDNLPVCADPAVTLKNIYVSTLDGKTAFLVATIPNTDTTFSCSVDAPRGPAVRTQFLIPPPPGWVVRIVGGRLCVAVETYCWYSLPYEFGLIDPRASYVAFHDEVRTIASVADGVYFGTAKQIIWFAGFDPTRWEFKPVAEYGTARGTEISIPNVFVLNPDVPGVPGEVAGVQTDKGFCHCFDGGQIKEVTGGRFVPPVAREGASLLKIRGASPQVVTTLFD